jgi:hypothetical protein
MSDSKPEISPMPREAYARVVAKREKRFPLTVGQIFESLADAPDDAVVWASLNRGQITDVRPPVPARLVTNAW